MMYCTSYKIDFENASHHSLKIKDGYNVEIKIEIPNELKSIKNKVMIQHFYSVAGDSVLRRENITPTVSEDGQYFIVTISVS